MRWWRSCVWWLIGGRRHGILIDFLLSALRNAGAAIPDIKKEGTLRCRCRHRSMQYLNNILEQDHRAIKRRANAKQGFREFQAAGRTIQGYEVMNMIRKGQPRWIGGTDVRRQIQFIQKLFELAAWECDVEVVVGPISGTPSKLQHFPYLPNVMVESAVNFR